MMEVKRKLGAAIGAVALAFLGMGLVAMPAQATQYPPDQDECLITPEVLEVSHMETIVDEEAWDETVIDQVAVPGQHYSHAHNAGAGLGADEVPPTPLEDPDQWQANTQQEPPGHYNSTDQPDGSSYDSPESGLHYASHGSSGHRDWFYFKAPVPEQSHIIHHEAVTHDVKVIDVEHQDAVYGPCPPDEDDVASVNWTYVNSCADQDGTFDLNVVGAHITGFTWNGVPWQGDPNDLHVGTHDNPLAGIFVATFEADEGYAFPEGDDGTRVITITHKTAVECEQEPVCEVQDVPVWHVWTGGPIEGDEGPAADAEGWNPNSGNPQSENHAFENHTAGVPYFVSHGNSGNGDWFLWTLEDCPDTPPTDTPVAVVFDFTPEVPTCDADGYFDTSVFPIVRTGYSITVDREFDGPGLYVLTATAADGFVFSGEGDPVMRTMDVWVDFQLDPYSEECVQDVPVPALFNADPEPATCAAPGFFDDGALGGELVGQFEDWRDYDFENLFLEVYVGEPGEVSLYLWADTGFLLSGLSDDWSVSEDGTFASRTILLAAQLTGEEACPTDVPNEPNPPAPPHLSETGFENLGGVYASAAFLLAGTALLVTRRILSR